MSPTSTSIEIGLLVLFFVSGFGGQKTLDKWAQDNGRAPMIQRNRRSWATYMAAARHEMPASVRNRIRLWTWIGYLSLILIGIVAVTDASWHHH
jgi:hypothetical protein